MPHTTKPNTGTHGLTSIWCIPAAESSTVLVIARYANGRDTWTHLMRWTPGTKLEHGAWTRLRLIAYACRVDPTAEFLCYSAATRTGTQLATPHLFDASGNGGVAVSRVPWLSALTDVVGRNFMLKSGGPSKHALSPAEQSKLWETFSVCLDFPIPAYLGEPEGWMSAQQPGWSRLSPQSVRTLERWPILRAGKRDTYGNATPVVRALDRGLLNAWIGESPSEHPSGRLLVRVPLKGGGWLEGSNFVRYCWQPTGTEPVPVADAAWAWIDPLGQLLTASRRGELRVFRPARRTEPSHPGLAGWRLNATLDISVAAPSPVASPNWARQGLTVRQPRAKSKPRPRPRETDNE